MKLHMKTPLSPVPALLALALAAPVAQAQSGYTVNTLSGGSLNMAYAAYMDNSNIAYGNDGRISLVGGIVEWFGGPPLGALPRSAKWDVTSAATASVSRRFPLVSSASTSAVSDDGVWQGVWDTGNGTTKRAKGSTISSAPTVYGTRTKAYVYDINNQGQMVGAQYETESTRAEPYYWAANQKGVRLGCGGCFWAAPMTINNRGEIGGWLILPGFGGPKVAAMWRNGQVAWTGDPQVLGLGAQAVAMNDAGTLVVQSFPMEGKRSFTVSAAGSVLQLSPQATNVVATDINAAGVVVGQVDGRAAMWVNGQEINLAAHLASKGVSVANTWIWLDVIDINDRGSMLATYRLPTDAATTTRQARLTAKP
jgi:hypothetical protein